MALLDEWNQEISGVVAEPVSGQEVNVTSHLFSLDPRLDFASQYVDDHGFEGCWCTVLLCNVLLQGSWPYSGVCVFSEQDFHCNVEELYHNS